MRKKTTKIILLTFSLITFFVAGNSISRANYSSSEYQSLYQVPQTIYYSDSQGVVQSQLRTGYKNQYNLDDPIIRCSSVDNSCQTYSTYSLVIPEVRRQINRFKVYVAPGTTRASLTVMLNQPSSFIVVARLGIPPQGNYDTYTQDITDDILRQLPYDGFSLDQLRQADCIGLNNNGFLKVADDTNSSIISESEGGWLYVLLLPRSGSVVTNQYTNRVNFNSYISWFRTASWDASGDPIESGNPTPTPAPSLPGDLNQDGKVDIFDYNLFLPEFGKVVANNIADLDKNGKVDIFDYNLLLGNFGGND